MPGDGTSKIAAFFRNEYGRMVGFVRSRIDDAADRDGEDIVQDVMANIFEAADVTGPIENLAAYVYRALRNRIVDGLRKKDVTTSLDPAAGEEDDTSLLDVLEDIHEDIESRFFSRELKDMLYRAIDGLPDEQRAVLIMNEFEGMTYRKISEETGIPVGTLLARKNRALERIRKELIDYRLYMEDYDENRKL